jgi:Protein of unknown function (DUF1588)/Protein of unknown function (DUF1585)
LMTAPYSVIDPILAPIYGGVTPDATGLVNFMPNERSGLFTQGAFLSVSSLDNLSSPVKRGLGLLDSLLCVELPPPPPNIVAQLASIDPNASSREIFAAHSDDPACRGCHSIIDPPGFAFENYDAIGQYRQTDKGQLIDTQVDLVGISAELDRRYVNVRDILEHVSASQIAQQCYATNWFRFAMQRNPGANDACSMKSVFDTMDSSDGNISELLLAIVRSDSFRYGVKGN